MQIHPDCYLISQSSAKGVSTEEGGELDSERGSTTVRMTVGAGVQERKASIG